jgi:hypothetical protein
VLFYAPADEQVPCVLADMMAHVVEPIPETSDRD